MIRICYCLISLAQRLCLALRVHLNRERIANVITTEFGGIVQPQCSYLVCATPRSGSTLLCEALANTGIAGNPKEYFENLISTGLPRRPREYFEDIANTEIVDVLGAYSRLDNEPGLSTGQNGYSYTEYFQKVIEQGTTPNGVFGAKVMWGYFDDFICNLQQIPSF